MKKVIDIGKRSKALGEAKAVQNRSKNPQFSREKSCGKESSSFT